jgi:hypothetical protein
MWRTASGRKGWVGAAIYSPDALDIADSFPEVDGEWGWAGYSMATWIHGRAGEVRGIQGWSRVDATVDIGRGEGGDAGCSHGWRRCCLRETQPWERLNWVGKVSERLRVKWQKKLMKKMWGILLKIWYRCLGQLWATVFWTVFWFESVYLRWFANRSEVSVCLRVAVSLTCITCGFPSGAFFSNGRCLKLNGLLMTYVTVPVHRPRHCFPPIGGCFSFSLQVFLLSHFVNFYVFFLWYSGVLSILTLHFLIFCYSIFVFYFILHFTYIASTIKDIFPYVLFDLFK